MLKWVFGADTSPFRRSLNEMRNDVKQFSSSAKSQLAGMFGIGAITAWVAATLDAAGRIEDLSKRLDMSAESFQRLSYASKLSGGDVELVGKSLTILTKNLAEAAKGGDTFADAAKQLGLNLAEIDGMSPEGQMIELSRGYAASADKGAALAAIMKLLGKSGAEIIPMIADGPEALSSMMEEATVATNEQIAAMAKIGDTIDAMKSKSVAALGSMIDGLKIWGAYVEKFLNMSLSGSDVANTQFDKRMDSIIHGQNGNTSGSISTPMDETEKVLAIENERKKLIEDIAKLEEDARIKSLSLAEKILDAEKRRAALSAEAIFGEDENKALEARKDQLEIEKDLAGYRKEQSDIEAGAASDKKSKEEDLANMEARAKAKAAADSLDAMSDARKGAESDLKSLQSRGPTIATSSLTDIGGGGGARMMEGDYGRKTVDLLAIIAANTAGGSEGSRPPEPI